MDQSLQLVAILFILSMICERISNFFKISLSNTKKTFPIGKSSFSIGMGDMISKSEDENEEKQREHRILKINIFFGFLTALALNASLIDIINNINEPSKAIGWDNAQITDFRKFLTYLVGWFMTGLFISLGSKFWHDLLDILLQVKNLRRKLVDERPYENLEDINQFTAFINTPESKMADLAYASYKDEILRLKGVLNVGKGYLDTNKGKIGCIEIHVNNTADISKIKNKYLIEIKNDTPGSRPLPINVPSKVVVVDQYPLAQSSAAGSKIANTTKNLGWGTLGALVYDKVTKAKYILSCYHVLNGNSNWRSLSDSKEIVDENNKVIAKLVYGLRTLEFDTAIATVDSNIEISNNEIGNPKIIRSIAPKDAIHEIKIKVKGATTGVQVDGYLYNDSWDTYFQYPDSSLFELKDLLALTTVKNGKYTALTQSGDSGAIVRDENNTVIGLVVGANNAFTYAIKMDKIEKVFDIQF